MKSAKIEAEKVIGLKAETVERSFTDRDSIIYALGIGFSRDPMRTEDYKFTSELEEDFQTFPTYLTCLSFLDLFTPLASSPHVPEFSPFMILHAEQRIELLKPLKPGVNYKVKGQCSDVADKGKIALVTYKTETSCSNGGKEELIARTESSLAIKGLGGFGYKGNGSTSKIPERPKRNPDIVIKEESYPGQAFLYRLSGDLNPLHIKPDISAMQNFPQPIIHGLCSYGIVARGIVQQVLKNNAEALKVFHARFVGHVFPGEKYQIELWKEAGYYWFRAVVVERNKECLIGFLTTHENAKL